MRTLPYVITLPALTAAVLATSSVVAPVEAQGQGGAGGGSGSDMLAASDFLLRLMKPNGKDSYTIFTDFDKRTYFNRARCECKEKIRLEVDLSNTGASKRGRLTTSQANVEILIGSANCVARDPQTRTTAQTNGECQPLRTLRLSSLAQTRERLTIDFPISQLYGPRGGECERRGQQAVRLRIDIDGDGIPDLFDSAAPSLPVEFDGEVPPAPLNIRVSPGNDALEVAWDANRGVGDFRGFVVLCSRAEDLQVYVPSYYTNQYVTGATLCGGTTAAAPPAMDAGVAAQAILAAAATVDAGDMQAYAAPAHFVSLDPRYVCSKLLVTQTSTRLRGLQNDIPYLVGVATIDTHFNPSPVQAVYLQSPVATRDFLEGYREAGGEAEGGYCAIAARGGKFGVGVLAVVALLALAGRRLARRHSRK